jgi:uncharacterized protein DUF2799
MLTVPPWRVTAFLFLAGCASLTEDQCRAGDWQGIGYLDGTRGAPVERFQAHVKACSEIGIQPIKEEWLEGREQGLPVYCTEANAYQLGRDGRTLNAVCPAADAAALQDAYWTGERYYSLSAEIRDLERELSDALDALVGADEATAEILKSQIRHINAEIFRLRSQRELYDVSYL